MITTTMLLTKNIVAHWFLLVNLQKKLITNVSDLKDMFLVFIKEHFKKNTSQLALKTHLIYTPHVKIPLFQAPKVLFNSCSYSSSLRIQLSYCITYSKESKYFITFVFLFLKNNKFHCTKIKP